MVVMIILAWVIAIPLLVVVGLLVASKVLGARARRDGSVDVTGFARAVPELAAMERARADGERELVSRSVVGSPY